MNSRVALPVPHTTNCLPWMQFIIRAGTTWVFLGSIASLGPYTLAGIKQMQFMSYCSRYVCPWRSMTNLATPYEDVVCSGNPDHSMSSVRGSGAADGRSEE